jgi:Ca-activated chloride channel family protein
MKTPGINKNSRRHFLRLVCSALVLVVCHATSGASQETGDPRHFQVESALITVPVVVRDAQGSFVNGLPAGSFKLFEDGRQVPVSLFLTSEDPIKIALLIDTSRSATTVLKKIKKAAGQFLKQMRSQDLAMVASFDSEMRVLCPLSSDARELKEAIKGAKSGGAYTRMRDAIHEIVQGRSRSIAGRKAIILLTDGRDQASRIAAKDLLDTVASSNMPIYSIFYNVDPRGLMKELFGIPTRFGGAGDSWKEQEKEAAQYLDKISDLSAGHLYASDIKNLDGVFRQISDELRSQYLLGFYPEKSKLDGAAHTLVVSVSVPDAVVRSRRSYRAAP